MDFENDLLADIDEAKQQAELLHISYYGSTIAVHYDGYSAAEAQRIAFKAVDDYVFGNRRYQRYVDSILIRRPVDGKPRIWMMFK